MGNINAKVGGLVKKRREELGMNQQDLARELDLPRPAISQIENGQRKISAKEILQLSESLNLPISQIMGLESTPNVMLSNSIQRKSHEKQSIRISVPQKNVAKFKEVLLYVLNKVGSKHNIGETVLYKLLYFMDFNFYEKYEEQLIGATYIKNHHGPTPVEFKKIVDGMISKKEVVKVKSQYFNFPQTKYLPLRKPDLSQIKAIELEVIDDVLNRLSDMNATQISDYSHKDSPWRTAADGGKIEYESVFYRTPDYSVRDYGKNIS